MAIVQDRAGEREDDFLALVADSHIRRARDELLRFAFAPGDRRELEAVGIRVLCDAGDLGDNDLVPVPNRAAIFRLDTNAFRDRQTERLCAGDLQSGKREALDEPGRRYGEVNVFAQPRQWNFHVTKIVARTADHSPKTAGCRRSRTSAS